MIAGLFDAYLAGDPALAPFFGTMPERFFDTLPPARPLNPTLAGALRAAQRALGLERVIPENARYIVTGQQAGIFGGPLYTVFKAVTAIRLAREVAARTGDPCVPLFWAASEDHDFAEVRTAHFLTQRHEVLPLDYAPEAPVDGRPMHLVPAGESLHALIDAAAGQCAGSELTPEVTAFLHDTLSASDSLSDWFLRVMAGLFKDTELVFFAPHWPAARALAAPVLRRELEAPLASTALVTETGARLSALGHPPLIARADRACNFFLLVDGRRRKAQYDGGRFLLPEEEGRSHSQAELLALLDADPERFSPNVALRPVVQQALFPAAAYVGGPGEVAYWAQLKPVFAHFGQVMPAVWPRARAVLLGAKDRKLLGRLGLDPARLADGPEAAAEAALRGMPLPPQAAFLVRRRAAVEADLSALAGEMRGLGPDVASLAEGIAEAAARGFGRLDRALLRADRVRVETVEKQTRRLCNTFAPLGKPQERVFCPFSWVFSEGFGMADRLLRELDPHVPGLQEIEW